MIREAASQNTEATTCIGTAIMSEHFTPAGRLVIIALTEGLCFTGPIV
jgi:hypothetical protein